MYCYKIPAQATSAGGIDSLESIPGLLKSLKIRAQVLYQALKTHWGDDLGMLLGIFNSVQLLPICFAMSVKCMSQSPVIISHLLYIFLDDVDSRPIGLRPLQRGSYDDTVQHNQL